MRIAISGAVSTGKTTLGRALAGRIDVPFVEENMEALFDPERTAARGKPEIFAAAVVECLERKRALERDAGRFVVDPLAAGPAELLAGQAPAL